MIYVNAFIFAGIVCLIGQVILDNTKLTPGHITALFVVVGAFLDLFDIYDKDKKMKKILEKFFEDYPVCAFSKLQDKSIIASLNHNQLDFADDGERFYDYIEKGILKTRKINNDVNWKQIVGIKRNNKNDYIYPAEYFRELLLERYNIK